MRRFLLLLLFVSLAPFARAQQSDVTVEKIGPDTAGANTDVAYTVTARNLGPNNAASVTLTDTVPAGMTFVSATQNLGPAFNCTPLPAAGSGGTITCTGPLNTNQAAEFTFVFRVASSTAPGTVVTNTASVASPTDPNAGNNSSSVNTTIEARADMAVTKTGPAIAAADTDVAYAVTVRNLGPDTASVTLTDVIPAGMTFVSATQTSGPAFNCNPLPAVGSGGTISCTAALPAGQTAGFTFVFHIAASTPPATTFSNIARVTSPADENEENDAAVAVTSTPPPPQADLAVTKTGPAFAGADTDVTYTIVLRNGGPDAATTVSLTDTLPGTMTFVSIAQSGTPLNCTTPAIGAAGGTVNCTAATYPAGASTTITLTGHVPAGAGFGTEFTNTVVVSSDTDPNEENDTATITTTVASADISVVKTGPATATAGANVSYSITVTNTGPHFAGAVTLTDMLPDGATFVSLVRNSGPAATCATPTPGTGGTVFCDMALGNGQSTMFTLTVRPDPADTSITNTATVTAQEFDPDPSDNQSSVDTTITPQADVSVAKSGPASVAAGANVTYTVTVANAGPSAAANVTVTDAAPANTTFVSVTQTSGPAFTCGTTTCTIASFAAGATATFQFVFRVSPSATGSIENTATVATTTADPAAGNNSSTVTTPVVASADVAVAKSGPATATPGADVTYTVLVTNNGPSDAAGVTVTDTAPANTTFVSVTQTAGPTFTCGTTSCTIATLPAGASATFQFVFRVSPSATGTIQNTATVTATTPDPASANNTSTVTTPVAGSADLAMAKTGPASVVAGTDVTYTVVATNNGPSDAASVTVTDAAPANTTFVSVTQTAGPAFTCGTSSCTIATLAAGASATFQFVFRVSPAATGSVTNTATIAATTADPAGANNTSTVSTPVTTSADLAIAKTGPAGAVAGSNVTYTVVATNNGPSDAATVSVTDAAPANATFVSATQTAGPAFTCTGSTCTIAAFPAGSSATFQFVFRVSPAATASVTNTATIAATTADPAGANNSSTVTTPVTSSADVSVAKSGPAAVASGTNVTYTVTVANGGPSDASNVTLTDPAPTNTTFVSVTQTSGPTFTCTATTCSIATLVAGATATFDFVYTVNPAATGTIENTATVTSATPDPDPADNTATTTTGLNPGTTDLSITKSANGQNFPNGSAVTYTIVVTNNGPAVAFGTTVTDQLPAGTTLESASASQGSCTGTTTVVCSLGTLAPAANATVTLVVRLPRSPAQVTNTATVTAVNAEASPANNASTNTLAVVAEIPAVTPAGLLLLAAVMAMAGWVALRS